MHRPQTHAARVAATSRAALLLVAVGAVMFGLTVTDASTAFGAAVTTEAPIAGNFASVSCSSSTTCTAVGNTAPAASTTSETAIGGPLIEHLSGTRWTVQSSQVPAAVVPLNTLACATATTCQAGGYYETTAGFEYIFTEADQNGHWKSVKSATPPNANVVNLQGMSCASTTSCFGVGNYGISISAPADGFIESYAGSKWSVAMLARSTQLNAISCPTATFCVAVGNNAEANTSPIFVYNGQKWAMASSPAPGGYVYLNGVSCTSAKFCVAVGTYGLGDTGSITEVFNGVKWTVVSNPSAGASLNGVTCSSPKFCMAVGNTGQALAGTSLSVAIVFNGATWKVTPNPTPSSSASFTAVSCTSPQFCIAVGNRALSAKSGGESRGLIERYNGATWQVTAT